ncbi:tryptophan--tRNA ligase [uncultured Castellaniella sp.]|uniref:tryptophan--tRNA ligase n=1 Tax=uncultured Castellaniella sp. TaxID=647907 RepID=UPI00260A3D7B|nr:tryptophan--tRNA ligase [uncultured Castellaniella sp.]
MTSSAKSPAKTRVLTGITTSGTPHLGNYAGAIRPAIQSSTEPGVDAFFFLADFHALIKCADPARVAQSRMEIAATWIAGGLDTDRVTFYRQSDVPEIPELCWMLTCVTAKGLMNRAHAYKASVDANALKGVDPDDGVTMGLFSYPVLMAADILMFNAHRVPVGRDQIQHLEMARDIAQRFNHLYGRGSDLFVLPEVQIDEDVATLPGLDGRKMSKSYNNTIPLFEGGAKALKTAVAQIVTDSRLPGEPKDAEGSHLFTLYRAFATARQAADFRAALEGGLGWGDAKQALCERIEAQIGPMRAQYADLMAHPERVEDILRAGAEKARRIAMPFMDQLREAVGLRQPAAAARSKSAAGKAAKARLVSFRDEDGRFRQRLFAADGTELLLTEPFADPKLLNQLGRSVAQTDLSALRADADGLVSLEADGQCWARCPADLVARVQQALAAL